MSTILSHDMGEPASWSVEVCDEELTIDTPPQDIAMGHVAQVEGCYQNELRTTDIHERNDGHLVVTVEQIW